MPSDEEQTSLLVLHRQTGGRPDCLDKLFAYYGSAQNVLREATPADLAALDINNETAVRICAWRSPEARRALEADRRWLAAPGHCVLTLDSPDYPARLQEIHDPPRLLFCDGDARLLSTIQVAVVGSRKMSITGRKVAMLLAGDLCRAGATVTSGLALGVDAAGHEGALAAGGRTVAVLGSGCDVIYPAHHHRLARNIRRKGGAIVSEFPLGTAARGHHFPQRNRIVTGLSVGTLVVEAALKSGSLISARLAMEQGREVFAVPGSVLNPLSAGCHQLIRDGAKLTERIEDIVEELAGIVAPERPALAVPACTDEQRRLLSCMGTEAAGVDALATASGLPASRILSMLIELEVAGLVVAEAGGYALSPVHAGRLPGDA